LKAVDRGELHLMPAENPLRLVQQKGVPAQ
jgi:hypothetical protein